MSGGTYGVGLLGLDTDLLEDDALGVGGTTEGAVKHQSQLINPSSPPPFPEPVRCVPGLEGSAESPLLVVQVRPSLLATVVAQLAGRVETTGLSTRHDCWTRGLALVDEVEKSVVDGGWSVCCGGSWEVEYIPI